MAQASLMGVCDMDFFKIGGRSYNVLVTGINEAFSILYSENTGRTLAEGAEMALDPLGTFFSYKVKVRRKQGYEAEFDDLCDYVSVPRKDGIDVEIVHNQTTWAFKAYVSNGSRDVVRIKEKVIWGEIELNIIPMKAQVLP